MMINIEPLLYILWSFIYESYIHVSLYFVISITGIIIIYYNLAQPCLHELFPEDSLMVNGGYKRLVYQRRGLC